MTSTGYSSKLSWNRPLERAYNAFLGAKRIVLARESLSKRATKEQNGPSIPPGFIGGGSPYSG